MRSVRRPLAPVLLALALAAPLVSRAAPASAPAPATTQAPSGEMTIIFIDLDRIISDIDEGKRAQEQLEKEHEKRQTAIRALEDKLKKQQAKVQSMAQKGGNQNNPALQQAAAEYQQLSIDYQKLLNDSNKEMVDKERELFDPIERRVKELLRSMASKENVDVVLSRRAIAYARKDFDFTERVTIEYNKLHPAPKAGAAPSTAPAPAPAPAPAASSAKPAPAASTKPAPATSAKKP